MVQKSERRKQTRHSTDVPLAVLIADGDGRESIAQARLLDISVCGAKLRVSSRVPAYSVVSFFYHKLGIGGRGTVRYCTAGKGGYIVGIEFPNGTGWSEPVQPAATAPSPASESLPGAPLPASALFTETGPAES